MKALEEERLKDPQGEQREGYPGYEVVADTLV
jgi:hypothetical protein